MSVQKSSLRAAARMMLLAAAPVIFTACSSDWNPSPMPTGYKYDRKYRVSQNLPVEQKTYPGEFGDAGPAPMPMAQPSAGDMATPMAPTPVTSQPMMAPAPGMAPMVNSSTPVPPAPMPPQAMNTAPMNAPMAPVGPQWKGAANDLLSKTERDFGHLQEPVYVRDAMTDKPGDESFHMALVQALSDRHYKTSTDKDKAPFAFDYSVMPAPGHSTVALSITSQGKNIITEKGDYDMSGASVAPPAPMASAAPMAPSMPPAMPPSMPSAAPVTTTTTATTSQTMSAAPITASGMSGAPETATTTTKTTSTSVSETSPQPALVTGPGSAPPPPLPSMAAMSPASDGKDDAPTYVYDGRSMNAPGKTAYEQMQGTNHVDSIPPAEDVGNH